MSTVRLFLLCGRTSLAYVESSTKGLLDIQPRAISRRTCRYRILQVLSWLFLQNRSFSRRTVRLHSKHTQHVQLHMGALLNRPLTLLAPPLGKRILCMKLSVVLCVVGMLLHSSGPLNRVPTQLYVLGSAIGNIDLVVIGSLCQN